ncbi:hypothetical protein [Jidongwangia harbinensis]|uniref:hypothetical protein n=1 Tax=Jidongwangia harbinensis TaxID=2878561 RepID=UPI001CD982A3|nr:hypothetical protein [Jidongwangia harbinensis]MCA2216951.1 hypothetical protein [Jidongwangia harbinensis]
MPVTWSDEVQSVFAGDLVTVSAYLTPAGGAVVVPVSPVGLVDRDAGSVAMTTSLAFPGKLKRLLQEPRVAMAYHTREHGFATSSRLVLAQGTAVVPAEPSPQQLALVTEQAGRFFGDLPTGRFWNWALREYVEHRLVIDIPLIRVVSWPDPHATGTPDVSGAPQPEPPAAQKPPAKGTGPRVDTAKFARQARKMPHHVIAYRGGDGYPVIAPVRVTGHSERGLHLDVTPGLLPPGGRRAGFAAHAFRPQAAGVSNRIGTGWLEVTDDTAVWAPHTAGGFSSPPNKTLHLLGNGLLSKYLIRKLRRTGALDELARARAEMRGEQQAGREQGADR